MLQILESLKGIMQTKIPVPEFSAILLAYGAPSRSGLSSERLSSNIINRCGEMGIDTSRMPSGEENLMNTFVKIIAEEVIKEIHDNARIETAGQFGSTNITANGANAGGPMVSQGYNINLDKKYGIMI